MNNQSTPRDFFINIAVIATLYASVASFLSLVFSMVNRTFPDALASYGYYGDARFETAMLIIVFPLFVWLSRILQSAMIADPSRKDSAIRRWFVYITLFLASTALVIDLVTLLNTFLSGEITTRFILKVLAVLVVAGLVFWHYLGEVRGRGSQKKTTIAIYSSSVLVLAAIVLSFVVFGSPSMMRKLRSDNQRQSDLQTIQWQIINYYQQKGQVPASLTDLQDPISGFIVPVDPKTGEQYGYEKSSQNLSFKLCAMFEAKTQDLRGRGSYQGIGGDVSYPSTIMGIDTWTHDVGNICFDRTIDPDLYPIRDKDMLRGL
ncbi:MAG TPA: DUF5671 domain-containing protein [Candidatus Paceibacterota bacterium]|jgi:hypothetical protein